MEIGNTQKTKTLFRLILKEVSIWRLVTHRKQKRYLDWLTCNSNDYTN